MQLIRLKVSLLIIMSSDSFRVYTRAQAYTHIKSILSIIQSFVNHISHYYDTKRACLVN